MSRNNWTERRVLQTQALKRRVRPLMQRGVQIQVKPEEKLLN